MIPADAIAAARAVRIEDELGRRDINLRGRVERVGPCPRCGGTDRFAVNVRKQAWHCRGCKKGGSVVDFVMHVDGCLFAEAVEVLSGENIARPQVKQQERRAQCDDDDAKRTARALGIWREAVELPSPALDYLARRRISLADVPEQAGLRFHHRCPWEDGVKPCIIAQFTDALTNEPRGLWRRPLSGEKPKTLGPMAGCVICLWPDEYVEQGIVLGEGVETTLAAATGIPHRGTLLRPAWATGGTVGMSKFPVLAGIDALTILVDNDANGAGRRAAEECAGRWLAAGRDVELLTPNRLGAHFNDIIKERSAA